MSGTTRIQEGGGHAPPGKTPLRQTD